MSKIFYFFKELFNFNENSQFNQLVKDIEELKQISERTIKTVEENTKSVAYAVQGLGFISQSNIVLAKRIREIEAQLSFSSVKFNKKDLS